MGNDGNTSHHATTIDMSFCLTAQPLEQINLKEDILCDNAGALSIFEGYVRCINEGKEVLSIIYDAHEMFCREEAQRVLKETYEKFDILRAKCFHRVGMLKVGEMAVWIGCVAMHREQSFKACRYIIDEFKKRLSIWKKEFYKDGSSSWINCYSENAADCLTRIQ